MMKSNRPLTTPAVASRAGITAAEAQSSSDKALIVASAYSNTQNTPSTLQHRPFLPLSHEAPAFIPQQMANDAEEEITKPHFQEDKENVAPINVLRRQLSEQTSAANKSLPTLTEVNFDELAAKVNKNTRNGMHSTEIALLKKKLAEAEQKIALRDQQLLQQQQVRDSLEQALSGRSSAQLSTSDLSDYQVPGTAPITASTVWDSSHNPSENLMRPTGVEAPGPFNSAAMLDGSGGWAFHDHKATIQAPLAPQPQRALNGRVENLVAGHIPNANGGQRPARLGIGAPWGSTTSLVSAPSPPTTPMSFGPGLSHYQQRAIGGAVSQVPSNPIPAFNNLSVGGNPWNINVSPDGRVPHGVRVLRRNFRKHGANTAKASQLNPNAQHYVPPIEPINYRRLLDRNTSCNWGYIVDKIVCNNDQQASIFLQQKLKVSTQEQKFELVEAIIAQAYPLMVNRFGNFLIQRCFEHGTPEQVVAIANAIRGKTLDLSMDAFGCHVVQKAFDVVPEEYKAVMVHELLRRIPETVVHRYACHVWQKLFELRWSESPPQIMKYVNEALRGMWHEVALGETGSLVVQNIFENCLEEDKRPCIEEVLASIDIVAHGQFGNWCIQHICEHGAPADKRRAIEQVLRFATEYSTDQFASKVVEKCLKVGGNDFLEHYLDKVCEGRADRPRMPLIDIAGDQYGNYLIQYILINAETHQRELVARHVRKHMVSLRGSKFGSRVAMLCTNPAIQTRPGPPTAMPIGSAPFFAGNSHGSSSFASRSSYGTSRQDFR